MDDQLITYVRDSAARGVTADITRQQLTSVGWDSKMVENAITAVYPAATFNTISSSVGRSIQVNRGTLLMILGIMLFFVISSVVIGYLVFATSRSSSLSKISDSQAESSSSVVSLPNSDYQTYINDEFHFRLTIPIEWTYKEYNRSSYNEFRLAFGKQRDLPDSYFGDGNYLWLRIYPVSSSTKYTSFRAEFLKSGVRQMSLGGVAAFDTGKIVGAEYKGLAYELHPPVQLASDGTNFYDENTKRIISSLRFTE